MRLTAILCGVVCLAMVGLVIGQGYLGRVALHDSQLAACGRGKLDRAANAQGWRAAEDARRRGGTPEDLKTALLYQGIAEGLEERSRVVCTEAFPPPRLLGK